MKIACKNIDRLVNVSMHPQGMPRDDLYSLYRLMDLDGPISHQIVNAILEQPGARIGIVTGASDINNFPNGECDGPMGSAALARALMALGYKITVYTENTCEMGVGEMGRVLKVDIPIEILEIQPCEHYHQIASSLDIAISIEKNGINEKGIQHSITGRCRPAGDRAFVDSIFREMVDAGKLTIGIGDGGNEIGFGKILELARDEIFRGRECICGCGGGIICVTPTRYLFPVAISNWGAYALCAALALASGWKALLLQPEEEEAMLRRCIEIDVRDGSSGIRGYSVDGIHGDASVACVRLIKEIVDITMTKRDREY